MIRLLCPLGLSAFLLTIPLSSFSTTTILLNTTGQAPLNLPDKKGFMDEVATEAFRRIGVQLKTTRLPAERGLKSANNALVDGEMSRIKGIDKLYTNLIRVPEKIMDWEFVAFSHQPVNMKDGWNTLSGKAVSHINGWKIYEKNIPAQAEITKTKSAEDLFNLLKKKRTDFALYEHWGGKYLLQKLSIKNIYLNNPPVAIKEMFIYLHKKHRLLVPKLSAALAQMKNDGAYSFFKQKHLVPLDN